MQKFTILTSICAPLPLINVDTDMIIPKQFLKTIKRTGLGKNLFHEMRFDLQEQEIPDFILNQKSYREAKILVSGDNFGCGSSREHAPWALIDFGICCIIAPSFADIFYNNCFKNGILPITLSKYEVDEISAYSKNCDNSISIDLAKQSVIANRKNYHFDVDPFKKNCLLEGLDDIGLTLQREEKISSFEAKTRNITSWLFV